MFVMKKGFGIALKDDLGVDIETSEYVYIDGEEDPVLREDVPEYTEIICAAPTKDELKAAVVKLPSGAFSAAFARWFGYKFVSGFDAISVEV